jgi:hypothetical protein
MKKTSSAILLFIGLITVLNMNDLPFELRLVDAAQNYLFVMVLSIAFPLLLVFWAFNRTSNTYRVLGIVAALVISVPSVLVFVFASSDYATIKKEGIGYSFEKIDSLNVNDIDYVLYRTNGGATTSYSLVLRSEQNIFPNINVVKVIYSKYKASESTLSLLSKNQIKMQIQPYAIDDELYTVKIDI